MGVFVGVIMSGDTILWLIWIVFCADCFDEFVLGHDVEWVGL
jgi:hypothetical protein